MKHICLSCGKWLPKIHRQSHMRIVHGLDELEKRHGVLFAKIRESEFCSCRDAESEDGCCFDCGKMIDPGEAIDRAMDIMESRLDP